MISQLNSWLSSKLRSSYSYWKLCYRASVDGWRSQTFHNRCDSKGATVTIVRVGSYIFGGYNDNSWQGKFSNMVSMTQWASFIQNVLNLGWGRKVCFTTLLSFVNISNVDKQFLLCHLNRKKKDLLRATRGARNPNLQVVITHTSHVCSQHSLHSFGLPLRI